MKQFFIPRVCFVFLLIGCGDQKTKEPAEAMPGPKVAVIKPDSMMPDGCYDFKDPRNHISVRIKERKADSIVAELVYELEGKDRNAGVFAGKMVGDKIFGEYSFNSEGIRSTRQVSFLYRNKILSEGFGEITMEGTSVKFKDSSQLVYSNALLLKPVPCDSVK